MSDPNVTDFDFESFLKAVTERPGVYSMLSIEGHIIYVGKAKNLKKRLSSYARKTGLSPKNRSLVSNIFSINVIVTNTESEALILENRLIKEHSPKYNILLRDDKGYPYVRLVDETGFPRLEIYRGTKKTKNRLFGPYPNVGAVRSTLNLIHKIFQLRQCSDSSFSNRSRPCLQHQIGRCLAPCVGLVSKDEYRRNIDRALLFLEGKSSKLIDQLVLSMEEASSKLEFEEAAKIRDQIAAIRQVIETQVVEGEKGDVDIVAVETSSGAACVQVFYVRNGRHIGSRAFFPKLNGESSCEEVISAFIPQFYLKKEIPQGIILDRAIEDKKLLEDTLSEISDRKIHIRSNVRGARKKWLDLANLNANMSLKTFLSKKKTVMDRMESLRKFLEFDETPKRMECFDISHSSGESTVASCVVFSDEGPLKSDYRKFSISGITPGDDFAAMYQALSRRYGRIIKEDGIVPDILVIDGGQGQLSQAQKVLEELQLNQILLIGVSKGEGRKAGLETIIIPSKSIKTMLPSDSDVLHILQHIRDEAHRFAVAGHRQQRAKKRNKSVLESIDGLGAKRRQLLLKQFGGIKNVAKAEIDDLCRIKGISRKLAQAVYDAFHCKE